MFELSCGVCRGRWCGPCVQFLDLRSRIGCVCGGCQLCVRKDPELHQAHILEARPQVQVMKNVLDDLKRRRMEEEDDDDDDEEEEE
jgi:hypothetical protein